MPQPALVYPEFLHLTHQLLRASVPMMESARDRCAELAAGGDPVAAALHPYWQRHIAEEAGHDDWVREDLAALGRDPDEVWARFPCASVASAVGAQYFWIRHRHPASLLGYVAVTEGSPPPPDVAAVLSDRTGLPRAAFRTLQRHAVLDRHHRDELRRTIDALPGDAQLAATVRLSALHTLNMLTSAFAGLLASPEGACR